MASAILTLPEGPPVDCFFACRLQIGRGQSLFTPETPEKQAVSPPQDGQTRGYPWNAPPDGARRSYLILKLQQVNAG